MLLSSFGAKRGTLVTLDGVDGYRKTDDGLLARDGWFVIDDSNAIPFEKDGVLQEKLAILPKGIRTLSETMLYQLGKKMLETYDCFEE